MQINTVYIFFKHFSTFMQLILSNLFYFLGDLDFCIDTRSLAKLSNSKRWPPIDTKTLLWLVTIHFFCAEFLTKWVTDVKNRHIKI